jgi:acetyltransferase-like isoleucine patch superfamily enzyme
MTEPKLVSSSIRGVNCGEGVRIVTPCNLYECHLGDGVFVGPFVEVQRSVIVGARTKIQSHCFICELVTIGEDCFIGHGVMFINDRFERGRPAGGDRGLWRPTSIADRVSIGSNATILPVRVCSDVVVGAGAVVTKDIRQPGIYAGNPARLLRHRGSGDREEC